jgi:hypothetical protein
MREEVISRLRSIVILVPRGHKLLLEKYLRNALISFTQQGYDIIVLEGLKGPTKLRCGFCGKNFLDYSPDRALGRFRQHIKDKHGGLLTADPDCGSVVSRRDTAVHEAVKFEGGEAKNDVVGGIA